MLTQRKKLFADYYLISLNGTDAAIKAGYTSKNANSIKSKACKLMKDPDIKEYIAIKLKEKEASLIAKQDDILKYLSGCVLGTEKEYKYFVLRKSSHDGDDEMLVKREVNLQSRDRIKAAEIMSKIYNMMGKNENKNPQKVIISYDVPKTNERVQNE